jgi:2-methylcitrate dehydratase PrpD
MSAQGASDVLASFTSRVGLGEVPPAALDVSVVLTAAVLEAGRARQVPAPLLALVGELAAPAQATVWATGERSGAGYAAFVNAVANDGAFDALAAAALVVPAALAAAEVAECAGLELLFGVAAGIEAALVAAEALGRAHLDRGFSFAGSAGRLGAALGASRVFRHDHAATLAAIGFVATQGAGPLRGASVGTFDLLGGKCAADGLEAALLAGAGLIGPPAPLEGRRGLFELEGAAASADQVLAAIGGRWRLLDVDPPSPSPALVEVVASLRGEGSVATLFDALLR